jgi:hypothetical protein
MSVERRHALLVELRALEGERRFRAAGGEAIAAGEIETRMQALALRAGLVTLEGLVIDGATASVESLIGKGPESLAREIAEAIAEESTLSEDERKN